MLMTPWYTSSRVYGPLYSVINLNLQEFIYHDALYCVHSLWPLIRKRHIYGEHVLTCTMNADFYGIISISLIVVESVAYSATVHTFGHEYS